MSSFEGKLEVLGHAATVASLLDLVTSVGDAGNYLILSSLDDSKPGYVQFAAQAGESEVRCEASGNAFIDGIVTTEGEARLTALGWLPHEGGNHYVDRSCGTPADRLSVAELALQTMREVYDWTGDGLSVELNLD